MRRLVVDVVKLCLVAWLFAGAATAEEPTKPGGAGRPLTPADLVELRHLSGLTLSPDGKLALVREDKGHLGTNTTELTWIVVPVGKGEPYRLGSAGEPIWGNTGQLMVSAPQWSADGQWIYFRSLERQEVQVWRIHVDGSSRQQVTHDDADVEAFELVADGQLDYAVGASRAEIKEAEKREYNDGVLLDKTLIPGYPIVRRFPDNGRLASFRTLLPLSRDFGRIHLLGDQPLRAYTLDIASGKTTPALPEIATRFQTWWLTSGSDDFNPLGDQRLETARRRTDLVRRADALAQLPSRSGRLLQWRPIVGKGGAVCREIVCTDADEILPFGWNSAGDEIVFETTNFGAHAIHAWNTRTGQLRRLISSDDQFSDDTAGLRGGVCPISRAGEHDEAVCLTSGPSTTPRLVKIDLGSGQERLLYDPNPDLASVRLGVTERITLKNRYGAVTYGWLVTPNQPGSAPRVRLPLVITSYTCSGFLEGGSGADVPEHVLADRGYATLCIDMSGNVVRQPSGFNQNVGNLGNEGGFDYYQDAIKQLDARQLVDPARVVATGFSASSSMLTFGIAYRGSFTAAIVGTQEYIDPITCYLAGATPNCRRFNRDNGYKLPYDAPGGRYKNVAPAWAAETIVTPLLMELADVEYAGMMQLYASMADFGRSVEMRIYPDEYHLKRMPLHRLAVYEHNLQWIDFWLRGEESTQVSDPHQYERWRGMRTSQCHLKWEAGMTPWYCRPTTKSGATSGTQ